MFLTASPSHCESAHSANLGTTESHSSTGPSAALSAPSHGLQPLPWLAAAAMACSRCHGRRCGRPWQGTANSRRDVNGRRSPGNIEDQVSVEVVTLLLVGPAIGAV